MYIFLQETKEKNDTEFFFHFKKKKNEAKAEFNFQKRKKKSQHNTLGFEVLCTKDSEATN